MRHDRTMIAAAGGPWPAVAERVRADAEVIVAAEVNPHDARIRRVRLRMELRGVSGRQLARLAGIHQSSIYQALRGAVRFSPEFWARLERALGASGDGSQ